MIARKRISLSRREAVSFPAISSARRRVLMSAQVIANSSRLMSRMPVNSAQGGSNRVAAAKPGSER